MTAAAELLQRYREQPWLRAFLQRRADALTAVAVLDAQHLRVGATGVDRAMIDAIRIWRAQTMSRPRRQRVSLFARLVKPLPCRRCGDLTWAMHKRAGAPEHLVCSSEPSTDSGVWVFRDIG